MMHLILTIMAIALMSALAVASVSYLNPVANQAAEWEPRIEKGLVGLENGYQQYVLDMGAEPATLADLSPEYAFVPPEPFGLTWSYVAGGASGSYFCWSGDFPPAIKRASVNLGNKMASNAYFVNSTCGATADAIPTDGNMAITYWVSSYE